MSVFIWMARLLGPLVMAGYSTDRRIMEQYGDEALSTLAQVTGVARAERWGKRIGARLGAMLGLGAGLVGFVRRYGWSGFARFRDTLTIFMTACGMLVGLAVIVMDGPRARRYAGLMKPLLPLGGDARASRAARSTVGEFGGGLTQIEAEIEWLQASLDRLAGVLADRELTTMAYPNRSPVQGSMPRISSGFGVRHDPFTGRLARHMGLDIPAHHGTAILASGGGRVISAGYRGPYGNAVVIDHGDGLQTLYGHCSKLYVRTGDLVMPQQRIASVGSTGRSTGPHLHFEVIRDGKRVAPGQVLSSVLARNTP
jgi:hypothetical protein